MARIAVFLNAHASKGLSLFQYDELKNYFQLHDLEIHSPASLEDLNIKIRQVLDSGIDYIISVGGDGTANTIAQHLMGSKVKLMILPAGTANDLASEFGMTTDLKHAFHVFCDNMTKKVDAIKVNNRIMLSNGGLGMACEVAKLVNSQRIKSSFFKKFMKIIGKEIYSFIYAQQMLLKPFRVRKIMLQSSHLPFLDPCITTPLILINNQEYIGGKFRVAPDTNNNDGKFNVTIFLHANKRDLLLCTLQMMFGLYPATDKNLISFETDRLLINSVDNQTLEFFGDGETFSASTCLNIEIEPQALEIFTGYKVSPSHGNELISSIELAH